jgi:formate dehydrogenase iron-sulfur subunit
MDRRNFFKAVNLSVGATLVSAGAGKADQDEKSELHGVLVDTTLCVGCRTCEFMCAEANGLPEPDDADSVFDNLRKTSETLWTVVNRFENDGEEIFVKKQCMHCNQPACAAACCTKAMLKTDEGPVIWRKNKCLGCRFCMISCQFDIPKFEYNSPAPKIQKCIMCYERLKQGEQPACVENCPAEALFFGKRRDLIETARKRIYEEPERYYHHIYGEHEVGGTGWVYLSAIPFEQLGFRTDLGSRPCPEYTREFMYAVPIVFTLLPPFLLALSNATKREQDNNESEE